VKIREKKIILFLFLGAFLVRMAYLVQMTGSPYFGAPFLDELYHVNWALDIAYGKFMRHDAFFRAPLYCYLLGVYFKIFAFNFFFLGIIQHFIGSGAVIVIYLLTRRVFSSKVALIAGIIAACYAPFFFFEGEMLDIFLQFLFYPLILLLTLKLLEIPSIRNNILLGLIIGLSAVARPNILLFLPVIIIFLSVNWILKRDWSGDVFFRMFFLIAAVILPILPVTLHNYIAGKCFVPISTYGGINFYIGNNPASDGYTAKTAWKVLVFGQYVDSVEEFSKVEAFLKTGKADMNAADVSKYWFHKSTVWIIKNPGAWFRLMFKKTVLFFSNHEIKNNKNIYFVTRYSSILRFFLSFLPFALVASLGVMGIFSSVFKKPDPGSLLLLLFLMVYSFGTILFFVSARYRAPVMTVLIPGAAYMLSIFWDAAGKKKLVFLYTGMAFLIFLILISMKDWYHIIPENFSRDHWSAGNCYMEKGKNDLAEKEYRLSLLLDPDYDDALNNLGEMLFLKKDYQDALVVFNELLDKHPDYVAAYNNLGAVYESLEQFFRAEQCYIAAIRLSPEYVRARVNLAEVLLKQNKISKARKEFKKALDLATPEARKKLLQDERFEGVRLYPE
jgi:tetratricopeptide (TPR) repeat protein